MISIIALITVITAVSAVPTPVEERQAAPFEVQQPPIWDTGAVREWRIHPSCNASQAYQIRRGLAETVELVQHAKSHILRWQNASVIYQKYFGDGALYTDVIGAYEIVVHGDRAHALFRCDDPDGNCAHNPTWAGHWRGNNATEETVICPNSFFQRRYLSTLCAQGYNVRQYSRLLFWASDLLHRLYHVPAFGQGHIEHYSEGYDNIVGNATAASEHSGHDSDGLQYFALDAYAHDIIVPGVGCPGPVGPLTTASAPATSPVSTTSMTVTSSRASTSVIAAITSSNGASSAAASASASSTALPDNCHTHADGAVHCV